MSKFTPEKEAKILKLLSDLLVDTTNMNEERYMSSLAAIAEHIGNNHDDIIIISEFITNIIKQRPEVSEVILSSLLFIVHLLYNQVPDHADTFNNSKINGGNTTIH